MKTNFTLQARRRNDDPTKIESEARMIAKVEGAFSQVSVELATIDMHRRKGRKIDIIELGKRFGDEHHYIKWIERDSTVAQEKGFLDTNGHLTIPRVDANRLGWLAFGSGIFLGISIGISIYPLLQR
jgi:hypothetical protein